MIQSFPFNIDNKIYKCESFPVSHQATDLVVVRIFKPYIKCLTYRILWRPIKNIQSNFYYILPVILEIEHIRNWQRGSDEIYTQQYQDGKILKIWHYLTLVGHHRFPSSIRAQIWQSSHWNDFGIQYLNREKKSSSNGLHNPLKIRANLSYCKFSLMYKFHYLTTM